MLAPGLIIENYEIVRLVAVGGMCHVYEARSKGESSSVAIKVPHTSWTADQEISRRFLNEARVLQEIRHPHVVTLLAAGTLPDGAPYMILQWLPFHLARVMAECQNMLTPARVIRLAAQIARALAALHDRGIVHRDIKAANVLLDVPDVDRAQVRLADLGLAKVVSERSNHPAALAHVSTGGSVLLGTWDYMAPEQWIKSKNVDAKADVYSLGVLVFQMLAGRLPFVAEAPKALMTLHLFEEPPMKRLNERVPAALKILVERMLYKLPKLRPAMHEVLEQLEAM